MIEINGKNYPLWSQFVEKKNEWIGGTLIDTGDSIDRAMFGNKLNKTEITDITLEPSGKDSAFFSVEGKDFGCGFDCQHGGIVAGDNKGAFLWFSGYGGHRWGINKKEPK